jgi:hypothetical protein
MNRIKEEVYSYPEAEHPSLSIRTPNMSLKFGFLQMDLELWYLQDGSLIAWLPTSSLTLRCTQLERSEG